jgi:hypothetical protein
MDERREKDRKRKTKWTMQDVSGLDDNGKGKNMRGSLKQLDRP